MSKLAFTAAALIATTISLPASAASIVGLYDTGVAANGAKLPDGSVDTHYKINGLTPVVYTNGAYLTATDAAFISGDANGGAPNDTNLFTLTFDLTGYNPNTASISGGFGADNYGSVFLNGTLLAAQPAATIYENFQQLTSFSASSGFKAGVNTLSFSVTDTGRPTALIVSGLNGTVAAVPEPATWAMMMLGFGMMGFGLRRRQSKVTTKVQFA